MEIKIDELSDLTTEVLKKNGIPEKNVEIITKHLIDGEMRGRTSHGVVRIPRVISDYKKSSPKAITVERETPVSILLNGGEQNGLVVAEQAMRAAIEKAIKQGIGFAGGFNCNGIGMAGYFTQMALEHDLIGMATANSSATLAPYGSSVCLLGTNPLSIAIPAVRDFILTDFSTAKWTFGDVLVAGKMGVSLPEGILIDKEGNPSEDPEDVWDGAILPIAGQKGSSLAVALEALAGPLVAAKAGLKAVEGSWGFMLGAINPEIFVPIRKFKEDVQALIDEINNSRPAEGFSEVLVPGQRSNKIRLENLSRGTVDVPDNIIQDMKNLLD